MWFFIRFCLFITLYGVSLTASAQNDNNPYELGDTVIVKDLADKAYQSFRLENGYEESGKLYLHAIDMIQCITEKYPQDNQAFLLNYNTLASCYQHYLYGDTTGLYSTENRKKLGLELSRRFGEFSRPMHLYFQSEANILFHAGKKNEAVSYMMKDYGIRKKLYPTCHPDHSGAFSLGDLYQRMNNLDSAIFWFKEAARWSRDEMGASYLTGAYAYLRIGGIFQQKADQDSSYVYLKKSFELQKNNSELTELQIENLQLTFNTLLSTLTKLDNPPDNEINFYVNDFFNFIKSIKKDHILYSLLGNIMRRYAMYQYYLDSINQALVSCHQAIHCYLLSLEYNSKFAFPVDAGLYYAYLLQKDIYEHLHKKELSNQYFNNALSSLRNRQLLWTNGFHNLSMYSLIKKENSNLILERYYLEEYKKMFTLFLEHYKTFGTDTYDNYHTSIDYFISNITYLKELKIESNKVFYVTELFKLCNLRNWYKIIHLIKVIKAINYANVIASPIIHHVYYKDKYSRAGSSIKSKVFYLLSINYQTYHPDSSLLFIQESVKRLANDTTLVHISQNAPIAQINEAYYPQYASIQLQKAQLLYALPATDPRRQYVDSSLTLAEQVADLALAKLKNSYDRIDFLATLRKIIETRLHAELQKGQPRTAYEAIERNRARMLFLHYAEQKANQLNQIPPADRFALDSLTTLISDTDIKLSLLRAKSKPTPEEETTLQSLTRRKIACEEMRLDILQKIESNIPEYVEGLKEKPSFDVEKFRQTFFTRPENTNKAVLEYFQTEDSLYLFCLTGSGLKMKSYAVSDSLMNTLADAFTATMADSFPKFLRLRQPKKSAETFKKYVKQGTDLYHRLVAPFAEEIKGKDLIIVPDGAIWKIPMEALLAIRSDKERDSLLNLYESLEENAYKFLPYLVQDHSVERRLSLTFETKESEQKVDYKYDLVAFAPVFEDKGKKTGVSPSSVARSFLNGIRFHASRSFAVRSDASGESMTITPLPESKNEVHKIAGLIAKSSKNPLSVKVFLQNEATESQFKTLQNQPIKYLHIATHGFANINQPNLSGLIFTPEKTLKEDGVLYAGEIQSMKYPSYLVTLSACETGRGKVVSGEGILGLMYGFMQSGTENVVSSYWTVNDRATSQMMSDLYNRLQTGQLPTHALRSSQKQMINNGYAAPYFWASFSTFRFKE